MVILELEKIGNEWPWVARITGTHHKYKLDRDFLVGLTDFSRANRSRTRGVYKIYTLEDGVYEISNPKGWSKAIRYFAQVEDGSMTKIDATEALQMAVEMEMAQSK